jgi:uncharacterized repeat protein (TIGR01451 family)
MNGISSGDSSGFSLSDAGDVNGDGFADLLIGSYRLDAYASGQSYVVYGAASAVPVPEADLGITKTDDVSATTPGGQVTYTIVASNAGPSAVTGAAVEDDFPAECEAVSVTSVAGGGATGNTVGPQAGNISDTVNLPVGASITYTAVCDVDAAAPIGSLVNTAAVTAPGGVNDPDLDDNTATDTDHLGGVFYTVTPCRLLDTRVTTPALSSGVPRVLTVPPACGIPATAKALALNLTAVGATGQGFVVAYPADAAVPGTSTLNFGAGQTRANNAGIPLAGNGSGQVAFRATVTGGGTVELIVDVTGYFE